MIKKEEHAIHKAFAALRKVEFVKTEYGGRWAFLCPACGKHKEDGHSVNCILKDALRTIQKL